MATWKMRRGAAATIAAVTLEEGEPAFTTDNHDLYVGTGAGNQFVGGGSGNPLTVSALGDVTISSVADNEVLAYNTATSTWLNQTATEASLGGLTVANTWTALNTFATIRVASGSLESPVDVTADSEYGLELHYSGNNYNVTGIRSRAQLKTTDASAKTAQGALIQASNNDGIDAGVLNGVLIEAIGKSSGTAATISTMRGAIVNTEWNALDTVTDLRVVHVRTHTRNAATAGYISGTGYGIYIENEAVGGNGQALDAAIYLKGTNLSGGNKAFTHGIDFTGATYGTGLLSVPDDDVVADDDANQAIAWATTAGWIKVTTPAGARYIWLASNKPTGP